MSTPADNKATAQQQQVAANLQTQTLTTVNTAAPTQMQPPTPTVPADNKTHSAAPKVPENKPSLTNTPPLTPKTTPAASVVQAVTKVPTNPHKGELVNFKEYRGMDRVSVNILATVQNPGKNSIVEMYGDYLTDNGYVCTQLGVLTFYPKDLPETTTLIPLDAFIKNNLGINEVYVSFRDCDGNQVLASKVKVEATKY